jgi:hypothetical protein
LDCSGHGRPEKGVKEHREVSATWKRGDAMRAQDGEGDGNELVRRIDSVRHDAEVVVVDVVG